MKLMTKELEKRFAEVGSQKGIKNPIMIAKFFNPQGAGTWLATEYNQQDEMFFGYVSIFGVSSMDEWGYFSLKELTDFKGRFGLGIERDLHIKEQPIRKLIKQYTRG